MTTIGMVPTVRRYARPSRTEVKLACAASEMIMWFIGTRNSGGASYVNACATVIGLSIAVILAASCRKDAPSISATDYDQSCSAPGDCAGVFEGTVGCCGVSNQCPNAAIRRSDLPRYMSDVASRVPTCDPPPPCAPPVSSGACPDRVVTCQQSSCRLVAGADAATDGERPEP